MSKPIKKIQLGGVSASVWENEWEGKKTYKFSFQKSWKNKKTGDWDNSTSFSVTDLPLLGQLCDNLVQGSINSKQGNIKPPQQPPKQEYNQGPASTDFDADMFTGNASF